MANFGLRLGLGFRVGVWGLGSRTSITVAGFYNYTQEQPRTRGVPFSVFVGLKRLIREPKTT